MPEEATLYDLMLLLSNEGEEERRAKIVDDVRQAVSSGGGSIVHDADWGTRQLAYRISHQADAEYHLLQFTGPTALLESLDHSLRITDGVLRFRIIKVLPGTPGPPRPEPAAAPPPPRAEPAGAGTPQRTSDSAESPPATGSEAPAGSAPAGSDAPAGSAPEPAE